MANMTEALTENSGEKDEDYCFFGTISPTEAAKILKEEGGSEGTWLVRESNSSPGNFVLSVIMDGEPKHALIHRHLSEDAVFSLTIAENMPIFHGLDSLINHYKCHPLKPSALLSNPGNETHLLYTLKKVCRKDPLPANCKLHGSSNLLHAAVRKGDVAAVVQLLRSGYRQVDARNEEGLTALHIACLTYNEEIIQELLKARAKLKVRDCEGLSPLHYLCRLNKAALVELLITSDPSAMQWRVPSNAEVALHEAAASRSLGCVEKLLLHGAPARPRNSDGQTPEELARLNHANDILKILQRHVPPPPRFSCSAFLHGAMSRYRCQQLLHDAAGLPAGPQLQNDDDGDRQQDTSLVVSDDENDCTDKTFDDTTPGQGDDAVEDHRAARDDNAAEETYFLVRASVKTSRFVLSLRYAAQTLHFEILQTDAGELHIDDGPLFPCLETLVDHYTRLQDGLPCLLVHPVPPSAPAALLDTDVATVSSVDSRLRASSDTRQLLASDSDLLRDFEPSVEDLSTSDAPDQRAAESLMRAFDHLRTDAGVGSVSAVPNTESPALQGDKTSEVCGTINPSSLSLGPTLGAGEFGSVIKGVWRSPAGDQVPVAVKTLHDACSSNRKLFMQEAQLMVNLNHPYIVKLLGVCHGPPIAMVQELAAMGALLDHLLDHPNDVDPKFHLKLWPAQVALGMQYLEQKRFVHRDLACRNLLLSSPTLVKITDFGLSRATGQGSDYYKASQGGKWPLKWYAPESINYGRFTHSSDVWSYGITLWEMYTFGDQPYGQLPGFKVVDLLERGERLPQPASCSNAVYRLMTRCWHLQPQRRPTFVQLAQHFSGGSEYVDVKPYLMTKG